ncbi:transposase [Acidovorax sp.]|uniref:transposase n=1 Tax=Acidovorax sp. TaxID=1872122 RepID=UPI0035A18B90
MFERATSRWVRRTLTLVGQHFWARGYFVSTVGRDEAVIREYIQGRREVRQAGATEMSSHE